MPVPIVIGGTSPLFNFNTIATVDWTVLPPRLSFFYIQGNPVPAPFTQTVRFPAFDLIPNYEDFTQWKFETQVVYPGAVPFCLIDGFVNASGDLGTLDVDYYVKDLEISFQNLGVLSEGDYKFYFESRVTAIDPDTLLRKTISLNRTNISFILNNEAKPYLPLDVTYLGDGIKPGTFIRNPLVFNYRIGAALPLPKIIYCFPGYSGATYESDDCALSYNLVNATLGELSVSFADLSALTIGQYSYSVTISNGGPVPAQVIVLLNVLEAKPGVFSLAPEELIFDVVLGGDTPSFQTVNVSSAHPWSIIGQVPDWLFISQFSGQGDDDLIFVPQNIQSYQDGIYSAEIVFSSYGADYILPVTMNLFSAVSDPFFSDKLHFTKDEDYLYFKTNTENTYFEITLQARIFKINTSEFIDFERIYKLPLFQKMANFHVGTIVHQLLNEMQSLQEQVPSVELNYAKNQFQPAQIKVLYEEKSYFEELPDLIVGETVSFQMIKGTSPYVTQSKLSLLTVGQQEFTRLTPNSVLGISFTFPGTPYLMVKRNTVTIDELFLTPFSSAESEKIIYSYFRFLNDFDPGDVIEISLINDLETRTQRFIVMDAGPESTFILFENQNGLIEPFEFSGRRRVSSNIEHLLAEKLVKLNATTKKIEASNSQSLIVNTGQLSKPDHKIVTAIVKSENVWVSFDTPFGPYFKIDSTTTKFVNQDTASNEDEFDIEFNILEDTDATIYPQ